MKKRGERKAQVYLFIAIAVVLIGFIIIIILLGQSKLPRPDKQDDISEVYEQMSACIEQRALDSINIVGLQGGYITLPENSIVTNISVIAYGLQDKKNILPSKKQIGKEIENYIDATVIFCMNEQNFPNLKIKKGTPSSSVTINQNAVNIRVDFPLSLLKGERTIVLDNTYEYNMPIRLGKIHDTADTIIEKQIQEKNYVSLTFLQSFDVDVTLLFIDETTVLYVITDRQSLIEEEVSYSFVFAAEVKE